ncbi:ABC-2 family transporter protein [Actinoalloteichus sp. GBA129-24]|uniref:ABC-2 family transporter protein n=2 Tax=Pseudonocardiaceae TaxID=2070 RepID=A0AAC9LE86_9PSEU|nr:ABC-2 family transporter protein [Actinoalloteichus fjordicus]APU21175.1 ABC-2 family transporter protein [Actinoalloteichus sp. GBA129-24]
MFAAIRSELTKIVTLPGVWIFTGIILGLHVFVLAQPLDLSIEAIENMTPDGDVEVFIGLPQPAEEAVLGLLAGSSLQLSLLLPALAAVIAGQEFRSHQLASTLLATPRRGRLFAAKVLAATLCLLLVAVLIAGISTAFTYVVIRDWNPSLLISAEALLINGSFLAFAVLFALVGLAVTIAARSTLVGVVVTVALIALTMTQALTSIAPALDALTPLSAGRNLLLDPGINELTAGPMHGLIVLVCWAAAAIGVAGVAIARRDAR